MGIDPKLHYCNYCHCSWKPKLRHKVLMLIFGSYTRKCNQCGSVMKFKCIHHVVKVDSKRVLNERIWENA